ncbi:hypothetical protein SCLCIDRAFT_1222119 [Scleroderma citrinum Foug A]|uniref:Uncharacterized protein n=1 Tax=Scleroderma citrinum Foug A TaxID=1036808 RepID=A0A0C3DDZ3_9AGAM|nr:hypothetical protein SCLCIDRAFT_1222119 [Scleroderma citrinum Foug A]
MPFNDQKRTRFRLKNAACLPYVCIKASQGPGSPQGRTERKKNPSINVKAPS